MHLPFILLVAIVTIVKLTASPAIAELPKENYVKAVEGVKASVISLQASVPVEEEITQAERLLAYWLGVERVNWWKKFWYQYIKKVEPPEKRFTLRSGTGLAIDSSGLIVTNEHLVNSAKQIIAQLSDGRRFPSKVVAADRWYDLAILLIPAKGLKVPEFGNSDLVQVGEQVLIIGNALGFSHSVSQGIISGKGRFVQDEFGRVFENVFQTDAAMNFGDSGGPLVNMSGQVVGLNLAIVPQGQNISFAMPMNDCRQLLAKLLIDGEIKRGWIGLKVKERKGSAGNIEILVDGWQLNSPAVGAGFQRNDVILEINGFTPRTSREFYKFIREQLTGETLTFRLERRGEEHTKAVMVGGYPEPSKLGPREDSTIEGGIFDYLLPHTRWMVLAISILCLWMVYRLRLKRLATVAIPRNRRMGERRKGERRKGERRKTLPQFSSFPPSLDRRMGERRLKARRSTENRRD